MKSAFTYLASLFLILSTSACANGRVSAEQAPSQARRAQTSEAVRTESVQAIQIAKAATTPVRGMVDTGQTHCYDNSREISCPRPNQPFYGQDAQYSGPQPHYQDNGDGTVTDLVTGLMWQQSPDTNGDGRIDIDDKLSYTQALARADTFRLAGYDDWRLPDIKELYSLFDLDGRDPSGYRGNDVSHLTPFIDTDYFDFAYGDTRAGERIIDSQYASSTRYVATTMNGAETMFGVNFADGRIKGYPTGPRPGQKVGKLFLVLYVRGATGYGQNNLDDQADTITDRNTGLMWSKADSGVGLDWAAALAYCENLNTAGHDDWRLPNAKELQSIVDYSRSPATTHSAAIDPLFSVSTITNEAGQLDYPFYWSSSTHASLIQGENAIYIAFGRAMGYMHQAWIDVHGAGAQRSDPKSGDPADWPTGHGPQGDAIRIYNYARCVRGAGGEPGPTYASDPDLDPQPEQTGPAGQPGQTGPVGQPGQTGPVGQPGQTGQPRPPQAAITACNGSSPTLACTIDTPHGQVTGTCTPLQQQLICVPLDRARTRDH